jgi:hypothetical protein
MGKGDGREQLAEGEIPVGRLTPLDTLLTDLTVQRSSGMRFLP